MKAYFKISLNNMKLEAYALASEQTRDREKIVLDKPNEASSSLSNIMVASFIRSLTY